MGRRRKKVRVGDDVDVMHSGDDRFMFSAVVISLKKHEAHIKYNHGKEEDVPLEWLSLSYNQIIANEMANRKLRSGQ